MNIRPELAGTGAVVAVCADCKHRFSKPVCPCIRLIEGLGVEADAHLGATVQHLYDRRRDPTCANLRQVHLIQSELFAELAQAGFLVHAGELGENITTAGIDLMALPAGTLIELGAEARIELTGLRGPCKQIDQFQPGLMRAVGGLALDGSVVLRKAVMAIVRSAGTVKAGDRMRVVLPLNPHRALEPV